MFNSLNQNNDPKPYYIEEDGCRYSKKEIDEDYYDERYTYGGVISNLAQYQPRSEFDNNPNPALLGARAANRHGYLNQFMSGFIDEYNNQKDLGMEISSQVEHAYKVFERLTRLMSERNHV